MGFLELAPKISAEEESSTGEKGSEDPLVLAAAETALGLGFAPGSGLEGEDFSGESEGEEAATAGLAGIWSKKRKTRK